MCAACKRNDYQFLQIQRIVLLYGGKISTRVSLYTYSVDVIKSA